MGKKVREKRKRERVRARQNAQTRQNKATMIAITFVVCLLCGILLYQGYGMQKKIIANDEKQQTLAAQIEEEQARTEEITQLKEYMQTEEYMAKAAQEKLGLLKENEILFKTEK